MKKTILFLVMAVALTTQTLFAQVPSYVPTSGLVGYWPFNGNVNDESGNNNNCNNPIGNYDNDRNGFANSSFYGSGVGSSPGSGMYISSLDNFPLANTNRTVSVWFKSNIPYPGGNRELFSYGDNTFGTRFGIMLNGSSIGVEYMNGSVLTTFIPDNNWHNITVTYNGSGSNGILIYLDGTLRTTTISNPIGTLNTLNSFIKTIGRLNDIYNFSGNYDDIGIWNRVLTETEIAAIYNGLTYSDTCNAVNGSLTQGLVGYWPFCGNANDDSGNGNNGTVNGATLTTDRFGNSNSAYSFNGINSWIQVANSSILNPVAITISAWIKPNDYYNGNASFIVNKGFDQNQGHYDLNIATSNQKLRFVLGPNIYSESNSVMNLNEWKFITATITGLTMKIYINGVLENTVTQSTNFGLGSNIEDLYFGKMNSVNFPYWFNGIIDDIGIWNRALTQEEITNLYNVNQCLTNITVTDTLIINVGQLSFNDPVTWANNITIAPNPASTEVNINFNNITNLNGGTLKIINSLGQEVATTPITTSGTNSTMQLATWGGTGMYFVQIINPQGQIVDIKKIILQ